MNRRDALKTFAAVAAGGTMPAAGAVVAASLPIVYFVPRGNGLYRSAIIGKTQIGFIGPEVTRNRVLELANTFGFSPAFIDEPAFGSEIWECVRKIEETLP